MGLIWSSPFRTQVFVSISGLFLLITGLMCLLVSAGPTSRHWLTGGYVLLFLGSGLTVAGILWCYMCARNSHHQLEKTPPLHTEFEIETLTSDVT